MVDLPASTPFRLHVQTRCSGAIPTPVMPLLAARSRSHHARAAAGGDVHGRRRVLHAPLPPIPAAREA